MLETTMTSTTAQPITLHLMEREFLLSCTPEERPMLEEAAKLLEQKMLVLRQAGHTTGVERVAMLAGLQIAVELLKLQAAKPLVDPQELREKIHGIETSISAVL
jgi:cell division protein ZapA